MDTNDTPTPIQQMFTKAWNGLKAQGFERSMAADLSHFGNPGCAYRGDDGRKCAVGHLIPNHLYHPGIENKWAHDVANLGLIPEAQPPLDKITLYFLRDLQRAHDDISPGMEEALRRVAENYDLAIPTT